MTNKKRILHVDDEPDTLRVVKTILEKEGFEVVSVNNGSGALKQVDLDNFSLVMLDIMMPDMSGWDLFTRISKINPKYNVIFLTVLEAAPGKLKHLKEHGIKDYITKPFDKDDLVARVKKAVKK